MAAATNAAKQSRRVLDVARAEAENSEDAAYVERVTGASEQLARSKWHVNGMHVCLPVYPVTPGLCVSVSGKCY